VDDINRQVVDCLLRDGRATFAEVGAQVRLSAPAAKRRVDRLVASGVIRGFTAVIDPSVVGWTTRPTSSCTAGARSRRRICGAAWKGCRRWSEHAR